MPGLKQLTQFSEDMRALGDEEKIRAQRGERVIPVALPQGISEADDSDDFIIGLPEKNNDPENNSSDSPSGDVDVADSPIVWILCLEGILPRLTMLWRIF